MLSALLTGWIPGPGGIPLALAGLALLAVHNSWAQRLHSYVLDRGSALSKLVFLENKPLQLAYDIMVSALLIIVALLALEHGAIWQVGLGAVLFCLAVFIGLMNRSRYDRLKAKLKRK